MNPLVIPEKPSETMPAVVGDAQTSKSDVDQDFEYVRSNLRELIDKGNEALDNLAFIAKNSEHPRAYEVVATLIKTLTDANKDMIEVQKKKAAMQASEKNSTGKVTNNNLFIGSTTELQSLLNEKQRTIIDADDIDDND